MKKLKEPLTILTITNIFKIQLSFPKAYHIFIKWLLLSLKYLSVKYLLEKWFLWTY